MHGEEGEEEAHGEEGEEGMYGEDGDIEGGEGGEEAAN